MLIDCREAVGVCKITNMKICLLTAHPEVHASRRLREEILRLQLPLTVLNPLQLSFTSTDAEKFDLTLNRFSAVDDKDGFIQSLTQSSQWGRQVNSADVRLKFWDKTRQKVWLMQNGLPALAFWSHRGELDDKRWRQFSEHHQGAGWVLKVNRGQKGIGVHFIDSEAELLGWFETLWRLGDQDFVVEPKLQLDREYRLTILAQKPWALLERKGFKGNFHQGGQAQELKVNEVSRLLRELVERMCLIPADYLSIDILEARESLYISDLNTAPGFEQLETITGRNFAANLLEVILPKA